MGDDGTPHEADSAEARDRRAIVRNALGVGVATGTYGLSFGALATASGLSVPQGCALSLLMFTGASQFAFVGVLGAGGNPLAAVATSTLLGLRNALYGLRLATLMRPGRRERPLTAQLVIDESTAMAIRQEDEERSRLAFYATGVAVFVLWNLATLLGASLVRVLGSPAQLGLDAAGPAAFVALLWPRLADPAVRLPAAAAALLALGLTPFVPSGLPLMVAAVLVVAFSQRARSAALPR